MISARLELIACESESLGEDGDHQSDLFISCVSDHRFEAVSFAFRCDSPCGYCESELDVSLDLSCMKCGIEKSELDGSFAEEAVEV